MSMPGMASSQHAMWRHVTSAALMGTPFTGGRGQADGGRLPRASLM
jgi:hypothetical protein